MELSFVLSAIRRRFWLVAVCATIGALPSLMVNPSGDLFRSEARLDIKQPTQSQGGFLTDSNRYVISQISVLESAERVQIVADETGLDPIDVRDAVEIEQEPDTDVVVVSAYWDDPGVAQEIASEYALGYMSSLETDNSDQEERERLEAEIGALEARLTKLNTDIEEEMRPWLNRSLGARTNPINPPPPEHITPGIVSRRNLVESELRDNIAARNALISNSRLRVNTEIIQKATRPLEPVPQQEELLLAGGLFGGMLLGIVAALAWARFSAKVLDEDTASEILGAPVVAEVPHYRSLARLPLAAFQALPRSAVPVIDQLCVLAEARAHIDQPLAVVVVGSQRGSGATTLALAMSQRFAAGGASVVLVDADVRDPRVTAVFNATADGGVPSVVANDGALIDQRGRSVFTRTMDPEVSVLGLGASRGQASLRRDTVGLVLEAARRKAQVVVIDGGPALDLASTLQFSALADAVVLAVPLARQKSDDLADLSRQLGGERQRLLPVVMAPSRRSARGSVVSSTGQIAQPGLSAQQPTGPAIDATVTTGIQRSDHVATGQESRDNAGR